MPVPGVTILELRVSCPISEVSEDFLRGMVNRLIVSYFKYGALAVAYPDRVSAIESLQLRIDKYLRTGNTEYLIDAANFAMIEFMHPSLEGAHFSPTDSDGSPGRVTQDGEATTASNGEISGRNGS